MRSEQRSTAWEQQTKNKFEPRCVAWPLTPIQQRMWKASELGPAKRHQIYKSKIKPLREKEWQLKQWLTLKSILTVPLLPHSSMYVCICIVSATYRPL